jgi:hypothetical protein
MLNFDSKTKRAFAINQFRRSQHAASRRRQFKAIKYSGPEKPGPE